MIRIEVQDRTAPNPDGSRYVVPFVAIVRGADVPQGWNSGNGLTRNEAIRNAVACVRDVHARRRAYHAHMGGAA